MSEPLAVVAYELWLELDRQRSRDARVMSPALRALQERLGEALRESLTEAEREAIRAAAAPPPPPLQWKELASEYYGAETKSGLRLRVEGTGDYWTASLLRRADPGGEWNVEQVGEFLVLADAERATEEAARELDRLAAAGGEG